MLGGTGNNLTRIEIGQTTLCYTWEVHDQDKRKKKVQVLIS